MAYTIIAKTMTLLKFSRQTLTQSVLFLKFLFYLCINFFLCFRQLLEIFFHNHCLLHPNVFHLGLIVFLCCFFYLYLVPCGFRLSCCLHPLCQAFHPLS